MNDLDQSEEGAEVVRSFMLTRGRTRSASPELPLETRVSAGSPTHAVPPEQQRILDLAATPISLAEISAHLELPLRTAIVMGSDMVAAGTLVAESTVEVIDNQFLTKIRSAFQSL